MRPAIARIEKSLRHLGWNHPIATYALDDPESEQGLFPFYVQHTPRELSTEEFNSGSMKDGNSIEAYLIGGEADQRSSRLPPGPHHRKQNRLELPMRQDR